MDRAPNGDDGTGEIETGFEGRKSHRPARF